MRRLWLFALTAVLIVVILGFVLAAVRPLITDRQQKTRRPTDTEYERLTRGVGEVGRVRLRITDQPASSSLSRARALGIFPGHRYLFVAERLLASLSVTEGRAIVAHESYHHRYWHPLVRAVLPAAFLVGWVFAIVYDLPYALVGGAVAAVPYWLIVAGIERWMEYLADRSAAEQIGYDPMVDALDHLRATTDEQPSGRLAGLVAAHPSFDDRIDRLTEARSDVE